MSEARSPDRRIVGFEQDEAGDWIAVLECGHTRHVRHRRPWEVREWVLAEEGRRGRIGVPLACRACATDSTDRREA